MLDIGVAFAAFIAIAMFPLIPKLGSIGNIKELSELINLVVWCWYEGVDVDLIFVDIGIGMLFFEVWQHSSSNHEFNTFTRSIIVVTRLDKSIRFKIVCRLALKDLIVILIVRNKSCRIMTISL